MSIQDLSHRFFPYVYLQHMPLMDATHRVLCWKKTYTAWYTIYYSIELYGKAQLSVLFHPANPMDAIWTESKIALFCPPSGNGCALRTQCEKSLTFVEREETSHYFPFCLLPVFLAILFSGVYQINTSWPHDFSHAILGYSNSYTAYVDMEPVFLNFTQFTIIVVKR